MGSGASCEARPSTPLDERLRTMLILRAYNLRPRTWTMKDQFDAVAVDGLLTKDVLRKALRLAECPRIGALLDRCCLFDHPIRRGEDTLNAPAAAAGSISVADLIAFVEKGGRQQDKSVPPMQEHQRQQHQQPCSPSGNGVNKPPHKQPPPPAPPPSPRPTPTTAATSRLLPVDSSKRVESLYPPVVPLTSKWALSPSSRGSPTVQGGELSDHGAKLPSAGPAKPRSTGEGESKGERATDEGGEELFMSPEAASKRNGGHCTALVRHLGAVLGLRGKEAYRRPGPGQPVWRKRETLIQERIVQYTTLDEEGTVQELVETEKSQTEVLHMECKRTGEFAHSESTHYESGEAFNGEVVLEEAGVERYVHLRSVDDEYEHLESTLPSRARGGGAAGGVGGNPPAEEVESGPRANDVGGDLETVNEGGGGSTSGEEHPTGNRPLRSNEAGPGRCNADEGPDRADSPGAGGSRHLHEHPQQQQQQQQQQPDGRGSVGDQGEPSLTPSCGAPPERDTGIPFPYQEDDDAGATPGSATRAEAIPRRDNICCTEPLPEGVNRTGDKWYPTTPSSSYHYRSPSCSPRLSPRPARSPYRQEGVGTRESSGRGGRDGSRAGGQQVLPQEEPGSKEAGDCAGIEGRGMVGDGIRPDLWPNDKDFDASAAALTVGGGGSSADRGGGGGGSGGLEEGGSADPGGLGNGCEGSLVLIDSHRCGGAQHDDTAAGDDHQGWWPPPESGSVLRGVDFAFDSANSLVAEQPPNRASPRPSSPAIVGSDDGGGDDDVNVSRLFDGLRSGAPTPIAVTNSGDRLADCGYGETVPEHSRDASPSADNKSDQERTALAPFHSQVWDSDVAV